MSNKKEKSKVDYSKYLGISIIVCLGLFAGSFIYKFATSEKTDSSQRWCPTHNTYHNINDASDEEIWCKNCKTWHAPNSESSAPSIK